MSKRLVLVATVLGVVAPFVSASPALASGPVKIAKIHYAQTGTNLNTEYIVFKNTSASAVQLKGWEIISAPSSDNQHYFFPRTKVGAGKTVALANKEALVTAGSLMTEAARKPGDFCESAAMPAASAADCSFAFIRVAIE